MLCLLIILPKLVGFRVNVSDKRSPPDQRHDAAVTSRQYNALETNGNSVGRVMDSRRRDRGLLAHRLRPIDMGTFTIMDYSEDLGA